MPIFSKTMPENFYNSQSKIITKAQELEERIKTVCSGCILMVAINLKTQDVWVAHFFQSGLFGNSRSFPTKLSQLGGMDDVFGYYFTGTNTGYRTMKDVEDYIRGQGGRIDHWRCKHIYSDVQIYELDQAFLKVTHNKQSIIFDLKSLLKKRSTHLLGNCPEEDRQIDRVRFLEEFNDDKQLSAQYTEPWKVETAQKFYEGFNTTKAISNKWALSFVPKLRSGYGRWKRLERITGLTAEQIKQKLTNQSTFADAFIDEMICAKTQKELTNANQTQVLCDLQIADDYGHTPFPS